MQYAQQIVNLFFFSIAGIYNYIDNKLKNEEKYLTWNSPHLSVSKSGITEGERVTRIVKFYCVESRLSISSIFDPWSGFFFFLLFLRLF